MTLKELIQKVTSVGRQITSAEIPVVNEIWSEVEYDFEIVQDADDKYYVQMTKK